MSQENVDVVRAAYKAWNAGDLDGALTDCHPEIEFVQDRRIPGAVSLVGRSALKEWLDSFQETWDSFRIAPDRVEPVDERVLVIARISARGRLSEAEVGQRVGHLLTLKGGRISRWASYAEVADALEAAGLSE